MKDLTGIRVKITEGAWEGEYGEVKSPRLPNKAHPITLDSGIHLAWFESEFEIQVSC